MGGEPTLPPRVRAEVKRILDREARRLLEEQLVRERVEAEGQPNPGSASDEPGNMGGS